MPTKTDSPAPKAAAGEETPVVPTRALLFQIEDIAFRGRKVAFTVMKKLLAEYKVELDTSLFARFFLNNTLETGISRLVQHLDNSKLDAGKIFESAREDIIKKLCSGSGEINEPAIKILRYAVGQQFAIGAVSGLSETDAQALAARLELPAGSLTVQTYKEAENHFPTAKIWLRTAKAMGIKARCCAVLGASMASCKSSLAADMRCLAAPDDFTGHQDYSGAEAVVDDLAEMSPSETIKLLFPPQTR